MTIWLCTNGRPSNGAKALAEVPGFKRCITGKGVKPQDIVINWGSSQPLGVLNRPYKRLLNQPAAVAQATNKLSAFKKLTEAGVRTVEWTTDRDQVIEWHREGFVVVSRKKLTGHSGEGILIIDKDPKIENVKDWEAPLYTKYVFKDKEFRVHVCNGMVVDTQQKIKDPDREVQNWKVRSHDNGFIFARNNIVPNAGRDDLAFDACKALGLDFGAVDVIVDKKGVYYVLEINTAPGLEGQTINSYAEAFNAYQG